MPSPPQTLENAWLARFYEYWLGKTEGTRLPSPEQIDPIEIPHFLPSVLLVDVVPEGGVRRYRFRLFGTLHVEFNQRDLTGRFIDEVYTPRDAHKIAEAYDWIVDNKSPHHWHSNIGLEGGGVMHYERLMLPLASDGETVDMLIGLFEFERIEATRKECP